MAVTVTFVAINVNTLNRGATVSVGENAQSGWAQHGKNNFGNGNMFGISFEGGVINTIIDNDIVDTPVADIQNVPTVQSQVL
ncbi:hypothetical protein [Paenibacillus tyrfis]|uniref:Uncharacterized protein n=1 Tax=Paenibacillus tyrfis TaxID=1501230 RepID=A0A081P4K0_9BACL|nr:hypothetical protein [Paenibacillus tyrfis]KEQ25623.1 hypothetical protein ET33_02580 [Paenibacillus tyrfis]